MVPEFTSEQRHPRTYVLFTSFKKIRRKFISTWTLFLFYFQMENAVAFHLIRRNEVELDVVSSILKGRQLGSKWQSSSIEQCVDKRNLCTAYEHQVCKPKKLANLRNVFTRSRK